MNKRNPSKPMKGNSPNSGDYEAILQKNLEEQNEYKIDVLLQNVNELKQIGMGLNEDITEEKPILDTVGQHFGSISFYLKQTLTRVDSLMVSHTGKIVVYLTVLLIVGFLILHFISRNYNFS
jgi:hypothetical protein